MLPNRTSLRLVLIVWLVSAAHATTNVVRETYLAVALAERATVRVDPYFGLNPDLFEVAGRGVFINSNPGASLLGAIPYAFARPVLEAIYRWRPELVRPKPPTSYDDPRPNRTRLMNAMRERGLDVRLALAALVMQAGLMAPLAALAALVLMRFLVARGLDARSAFAAALLYALGTPILFRSAFLNQNVLLAHAVLGAWVLLRRGEEGPAAGSVHRRWLGAGLLLGGGVLLDYSALPIAATFALWAALDDWRCRSHRPRVLRTASLASGAAGPLALLLAYQTIAFGSPWPPAQGYMPATEFSVRGWHGITPPSLDLLWRNLFDPRYGLFVFCPLLLLAMASHRYRHLPGAPSRQETRFAWLACGGLWVFESANQFANLQWNTGVRYLVPAVPLLFLLALPVLRALSPIGRVAWIGPTVLVSWSVAMMRESVPASLKLLVIQGPSLPQLRTLRKTADAYAPWLAQGLQPWGLLSVLALGGAIAIVWRATRRSNDA